MSYILDALKKAEYEREAAQFVDYGDDFEKKSWFAPNFWVWGMIIVGMLIFIILLWPSKIIPSQQVYIVPPTPAQSVSLSEQLEHNY